MDLLQFLNYIKESPNLTGIFILNSNSEDSSLLAQKIFEFNKRHVAMPVKKIDANCFDEILPELHVSFLGSNIIYWVIGGAAQKKWLKFIANYKGPHTIIICESIDDEEAQKLGVISIEIPKKIDINYYNRLFYLFYNNPPNPFFSQKLFKIFPNIDIEQACKIMGYQAVIGKNAPEFFDSWIDKLIAQEKSLYTLSQYLFSGQAKDFFDYWAKIKLDYADEFWISYWSSTIWHAATFLSIAISGNTLEAKKSATGLPFSFINKDYRFYNIEFLAKAHNFLYAMDYNMKNGCNSSLELWYSKFLLKDF